MARPRKYVRVIEAPDGSLTPTESGGTEVHGLSFNKSNQTYYTIVKLTGKRKYLGRDIDDAVAEVERPQRDHEWEAAMNIDIDIQRATNDLISGPIGKEDGCRPDKEALEAILAFARQAGSKDAKDVSPSKQRLSDCLKTWVDWMTQDGTIFKTDNVKDNEKRFRSFSRCVGNLSISTITHDHFVKWQKWIRSQSNWKSAKTGKDHHATVKKILSFAKRKKRDWNFPVGLLEWADDWKMDDKTPYVPKQSNREPMPVHVYRRCLAVTDEWASIDLEQYDATTQKGRGQRRQAIIKQREGVQFAALLRLIIHGLDTVDCTRIRWSNLIDLDGDLPYFDFPRSKVKHRTGFAIDRKTPLLPSCVSALQRWQRYENPVRTVFRTSQGTPYNSSTLAGAFAKLRENQDWSLKHLRNVGGSLADQNGMSEMMVDRFLGHTLKKARAKYLGSVGPEYLAELVKLIGAEYLDFPGKA